MAAERRELYEAREDLTTFVPMDLPEVQPREEGGEQQLSFSFVDKEWLGPRAVVVHNVLSASECDAVLRFMHQSDPQMIPAGSTPSYRNNTRIVVSCPSIASTIAARVFPLLAALGEDKKIVDESNRADFLQNGMGMDGLWEASSINPCFRLCKYCPGGHFAPHFDGDYIISPLRERSLKTFMIYLNDDYSGGSTNFLTPHDIFFDEARGIFSSHPDHVKVQYKARRGDAIVFDHKLLHEGAQVLSGEKFIMRSDLVFTKVDRDGEEAIPPHVQRAIELFSLGTKMEERKEYDGAVAMYAKAFKLCPELERFT